MPSDPMVMLTCRVPAPMKAALTELARRSEPSPEGEQPDRSDVTRRLLADGIRRAFAAANHPARLPDDLRPDAAAPRP